MPPTKAQTIKIHIAIKELGMDDDSYRDLLAVNFGVLSSKDMSPEQAGVLLAILRAKGWQPKAKQGKQSWGGKSQYIQVQDPQQRKVLALWNALGYDMDKIHTRVKTQFGVDRFEWLRDYESLRILITDLQQRLEHKETHHGRNNASAGRVYAEDRRYAGRAAAGRARS